MTAERAWETLLKSDLPCVQRFSITSRVTRVLGPVIRAGLFPGAAGDLVSIETRGGGRTPAVILGFDGEELFLGLYENDAEILPGAEVGLCGTRQRRRNRIPLGSVVDALGKTLLPGHGKIVPDRDSKGVPHPLVRARIDTPFETGIRSIDAFTTLGRGQRVCILAEPGTGKSTLAAMLAATSDADATVIALVGERGREVRELIDETLSAAARAKTILVVSTSDESALRRAAAVDTATGIAEALRAAGLHVLLQIDSLTRYLRALRELGLAAGEIPVRRGYPPSAFSTLPRVIERAGTSATGSITAFYTMLTSGDAEQDPLVDEVKSLTDGHIVLSRALAESGRYPAVDVLRSLSRLQPKVVPREHLRSAAELRRILAALDAERELMAFGAAPSHLAQTALQIEPELEKLLFQGMDERTSLAETRARLCAIASRCAGA